MNQTATMNNMSDTDLSKYVELNNISHQYGDKLVLDDISLNFGKNEIICLLGSSGSGKSTLLRLIAGVENLKDGEITINDKVIVNEQIFVAPDQRNVGMVFQDYALFPHLTVLKNVMFGKKKNGEVSENEALEMLKYIGLDEYAHQYPNTLSGGQQQRVALARTLVTNPDILLLDEPFSGLDANLRKKLRVETKALIKEKNISAIFVTHDAEEALYLADKIILLNNGKVEQMGTPDELLNNPVSVFAAQYLRRYNEIDVAIEDSKVITPFGNFSIDLLSDEMVDRVQYYSGQGKLLVAENDIHLESYDDPADDDHHIEVIVEHIALYSEFSELVISIEGFEEKLTLRTSLREKPVKIGQKFNAHFHYKHVLLFKN